MAYSTQRAVSDGTLVLLNLSIDYFDRSEISVLLNNVVSPPSAGRWAWVGTTNTQITFGSVPIPAGVEVTVKRTTQLAAPLHQYTKGAQFIAETLDQNFTQVLRIAQDASEGNASKDFFANVDFHGYQIKNLGNATQPQDAVTLAQYQADSGGASQAALSASQSAASAAASAAFSATVNLGAFRNVLINGGMNVQQRPGPYGGGYGFDRWFVNVAGTAPGVTSYYGMNFGGSSTEQSNVLTVLGSAGNAGHNLVQRVEAANCRHMAGRVATVSYWYYNGTAVPQAVGTGLASANALDNFSATTNAGQTAVTAPAGTWTFITYTATIPANAVNGIAVTLGNGHGPIPVGQNVAYGNVQFELGSAPTPFERRPYGLELALCQRYYATVSNSVAFAGNTTNGASYWASYLLPVTMRAIPTLTGASQTGSGFASVVGSFNAQGDCRTVNEVRAATATASGALYGSTIAASAEL